MTNHTPDESGESRPTRATRRGVSGNRSFIVVAGILGGIILLILIALVFFGMQVLPQRQAQEATQIAEKNLHNTEVAKAATQTEQAVIPTPTSTRTPTRLPITPPPTVTPVVVLPTDLMVTGTQIPSTATVAALLTQLAGGGMTVTPTATALPQTGFAEEVGIPGLFGLALLLIVIIFLARRLRLAG